MGTTTNTSSNASAIPSTQGISLEDAGRFIHARGAELDALIARANATRDHYKGSEVRLCAITNAKSGHCPEDCGFCSQSSRYETDAPEYKMRKGEDIAGDAIKAWEAGAGEFSIVTSGRALNKDRDLREVETALKIIKENTSLMRCASLGLMEKAELVRLKEAGLQALHHNVETARSYHPNVVTSHSYDDEVAAVKAAKEVGLHVCCGGIFGMGESAEQRVEMLQALRDMDVDSIPLNFLNPRPGTPLAEKHNITAEEALAAIAVARLMMPTKELFVCGGREVNLGERLDQIFMAGANGTMVGNYLTTQGRGVGKDLDAIRAQGLTPVGVTESATAPEHIRRLVKDNPQPARKAAPLSERGRNALPVLP